MLRIRRALLTVSDKTGVVELARALQDAGAELVATGRTAAMLRDAGLKIVPIEEISGSPEAFQGRMKTLSFPVCSGILSRRGDASDEQDLKKLGIQPIDCVVVNFYPFEEAAAKPGISRPELIEQIDIGGPTLVRAAAKNAPDVLVLTDPSAYASVIAELKKNGGVSEETAFANASGAWDRILEYDSAIAQRLGGMNRRKLRYGENPHQQAVLEWNAAASPVAWPVNESDQLTPNELSYNNILDFSAAYALASDLDWLGGGKFTGVVIIKHNNPCGVALVPKTTSSAQLRALELAWAGDPVSAFGGVVVFTEALSQECASWLSERFIELVAAPGLSTGDAALEKLMAKRKKLKAISVRRWGELPREMLASVPGGKLIQDPDVSLDEPLKSVTKTAFPASREMLSRFGIAVCRILKSNAVALVREVSGAFQLVGAGQGQPNRIEALEKLTVPRARAVLAESGGEISDCLLISDAFFPFRDTVDTAHAAGIRTIVQPGGSLKDADSIAACDEHGISMAFTGRRHFRH